MLRTTYYLKQGGTLKSTGIKTYKPGRSSSSKRKSQVIDQISKCGTYEMNLHEAVDAFILGQLLTDELPIIASLAIRSGYDSPTLYELARLKRIGCRASSKTVPQSS